MALKMFVDAQRPANDGVSRCPMQPGDDLPQVPSIDGSIRWCPNKAHQSWTHKASMTKGYWKPARRMALVEALWFFFSLVEIMFEGDPGPTAAQENTSTMFPFLFMLRRLPWAQAKIEASFKRGVLVKHCVLWSWLRFHKSFLLPSNPELQALTVLKFARCWQADPLWVDARQCTPIWKLARGANDPMQAAFSLPPAATDWLVSCFQLCSLRLQPKVPQVSGFSSQNSFSVLKHCLALSIWPLGMSNLCLRLVFAVFRTCAWKSVPVDMAEFLSFWACKQHAAFRLQIHCLQRPDGGGACLKSRRLWAGNGTQNVCGCPETS